MCTATEPTAPASTGQALAMVRAGLGYLAGCDAASLGTGAQAEALIGLEHAEAQHTAARARILSVFTAQQGYEADGQYGAAAWLRVLTRVTRGAAGAATGWARRLGGHPVIAAALAAGQLPVSLARLICDWTDKLPGEFRDDADGILLAAVLGGADQYDLARLAREMIERSQTSPDRDRDRFEERALWLAATFDDAGRLQGDLTPACATALTVVLDALGQKAGPEDTRTLPQRRHDAIEEACRRLICGQMIPGRDGQPPHLTILVDLSELRGGSVLERSWTPAMAAAGPGSVYLTGPAGEAAACDAVVTPVVTGQIDWAALGHLTTLWLITHGHTHPRGPQENQADGPDESHGPQENQAGGPPENQADGPDESHGPQENQAGGPQENHDPDQAAANAGHVPGPGCGHAPGPGSGYARGPGSGHVAGLSNPPATADDHDCGLPGCFEATRQRLRATILRWSLDVLSGPGGLAGHLRGTLLAAPFNTLSQPLDIGRTTRTIPTHLRTAVILRDKHCQFPHCTQPASVCEIHHLIPWTKDGPTSLGNLRLLCRFHHQIAIHRWGWKIACHPDGTRTATAPNGGALHSHSPPQQAA